MSFRWNQGLRMVLRKRTYLSRRGANNRVPVRFRQRPNRTSGISTNSRVGSSKFPRRIQTFRVASSWSRKCTVNQPQTCGKSGDTGLVSIGDAPAEKRQRVCGRASSTDGRRPIASATNAAPSPARGANGADAPRRPAWRRGLGRCGGTDSCYFLQTAVRKRPSGLWCSAIIRKPPCSCSSHRKAAGA